MKLVNTDDIKYQMLYKENFLSGTGVEAPAVWKSDIDAMPAVDAVPVVRCRNCAKRGKNEKGIPGGCPFGMTDDTCDPNAYCSYGVLSMKMEERQDGEYTD